MIRGGDLFGDGVNIAARLQTLAEPGGLCLSSEAHAHVRKTLPFAFEDLGPQHVKNIAEPVNVYAYRPQPGDTALHASTPLLPLPETPSIAVLPFKNMGGDRYFADGVVEDIITALSRTAPFRDRPKLHLHVQRQVGRYPPDRAGAWGSLHS